MHQNSPQTLMQCSPGNCTLASWKITLLQAMPVLLMHALLLLLLLLLLSVCCCDLVLPKS